MAIGKFVVRKTGSGIKFDLKASNGEVISTSEVYSSARNCKAGIASVKKNAPLAEVEDQTVENPEKKKHPKFELYTDKRGETRFRLKANNGQIIASSGEGYKTKTAALNGIESVKKNAPEAPIVEETEEAKEA